MQIGLILTIVSIFTHYIFHEIIQWYWYQIIVDQAHEIFKPKAAENNSGVWRIGGVAVILLWTYIWGCIVFVYYKAFKKLFKPHYEKKMLIWHAEAIKDNRLLKLLSEHDYRERNQSGSSIMFTLNTGKIYIGWVKKEPDPSQNSQYIRILPIISGYRVPETQEEKLITPYRGVINKVENSTEGNFKHMTEDNFDIVFPVDAIVSAHPFELKTYKLFKEQKQKIENSDDDDKSTKG